MKEAIKSRFRLLIAALTFVVVVVGCTNSYEDLATSEGSSSEDVGTSVSFSFNVDDLTSATGEEATRATSDDDEEEEEDYAEIANLWILQYNEEENLVRSKYISDATTLDAPFTLTVDFTAEEIIFVANTSDDAFADKCSTISSLEALTYEIVAHNDVLKGEYCVMSKSVLVSDISPSETNSILLRRNAAKISIKITDNLSDDEWEFLSVETLNIQNLSYYYPDEDATTFPTSSSLCDYKWSSDEVSESTGDGLTFYLPINKGTTLQEGATAIKVYYYKKANPFEGVSFTYYLGDSKDYNLLANNSYNHDLTIEGFGINDSRVAAAAYEAKDLGDVILEMCTYDEVDVSNCYIINPTSSGNTIYIPIEGRINTFWGNKGYEYNIENILTSGADWEVDILWSDIPGVVGSSSSKAAVSTAGGFTAERVLTSASTTTQKGNTIDGSTALQITLSSAFSAENTNTHGNVVVGIRNTDYSEDQDNYLWSWHFWITDYDPDGTRTSSSTHGYGGEYVWTVTGGEVVRLPDSSDSDYAIWSGAYSGKYMMDRPIGAITNKATNYEDNRGALYYQFGRKDPFSLWVQDATESPYSTTNISDNIKTITTMESSVQCPTNFAFSWTDIQHDNDGDYVDLYNVWHDPKQTISESMGQSATEVGGKSIFDPSPLGWKVPARYTWTYISTSTSLVTIGTAGLYSSGFGLYMGTSSATTDSYYAYYPTLGYIQYSTGALTSNTSHGYHWSSSPRGTATGCCMYFYSSYMFTNTSSGRGIGRNVVPVQE